MTVSDNPWVLSCRLDSLKEVHRARQAELRRLEGDVENARSSVEILEETSSESQLKFYRSMTLYVHNLVECLREKVGQPPLHRSPLLLSEKKTPNDATV